MLVQNRQDIASDEILRQKLVLLNAFMVERLLRKEQLILHEIVGKSEHTLRSYVERVGETQHFVQKEVIHFSNLVEWVEELYYRLKNYPSVFMNSYKETLTQFEDTNLQRNITLINETLQCLAGIDNPNESPYLMLNLTKAVLQANLIFEFPMYEVVIIY
jgi:hypothetical protein